MNEQDLDLYTQLSKTKTYRERWKLPQRGDRYESIGSNYAGLWITPVYDPENPERCLWGMVDWERWHMQDQNGNLLIFDINKKFTDRLDIALIKTILAQEGR